MPCDTPGIPESLHINGRLSNQDFTSDNRLFIRVKPTHFVKSLVNGNSQTVISIQAFTTDQQSSNRDSCSDAEDVLYNINASNAGDHFFSWGVISLGLAELVSKQFHHPEVNLSFKPVPSHNPEDCMYPHTEILFKDVNTNNVVPINARSLKAQIKGHYLDVLMIEKNPLDNSL